MDQFPSPAEIITLFQSTQTANYFNLAAAVLAVYDIMLTFPSEYAYIWRKRWSLPNILYVLCRHYGTFTIVLNFIISAQLQSSLPLCKVYLVYRIVAAGEVVTILVNVICLTRLRALYRNARGFLPVMLVIFAAELAVELWAAAALSEKIVAGAGIGSPFFPLPGCYSIPSGEALSATLLWVMSLFFSTILFLLMLKQYLTMIQRLRTVDSNTGLELTPMLKAFYTSGTVWYLVFTVALIAHAMSYYLLQGAARTIGLPWLTVCQSIAGSRLILDLRESDHMQTEGISTGRNPRQFEPEHQLESLAFKKGRGTSTVYTTPPTSPGYAHTVTDTHTVDNHTIHTLESPVVGSESEAPVAYIPWSSSDPERGSPRRF